MTERAAIKQANDALKLMPAGWEPRVWESDVSTRNWEWCLAYDRGRITVHKDRQAGGGYMAMASISHPYSGDSENWGISEYFDHPRKAVENILERLRIKIGLLSKFVFVVSVSAGFVSSNGKAGKR